MYKISVLKGTQIIYTTTARSCFCSRNILARWRSISDFPARWWCIYLAPVTTSTPIGGTKKRSLYLGAERLADFDKILTKSSTSWHGTQTDPWTTLRQPERLKFEPKWLRNMVSEEVTTRSRGGGFIILMGLLICLGPLLGVPQYVMQTDLKSQNLHNKLNTIIALPSPSPPPAQPPPLPSHFMAWHPDEVIVF